MDLSSSNSISSCIGKLINLNELTISISSHSMSDKGLIELSSALSSLTSLSILSFFVFCMDCGDVEMEHLGNGISKLSHLKFLTIYFWKCKVDFIGMKHIAEGISCLKSLSFLNFEINDNILFLDWINILGNEIFKLKNLKVLKIYKKIKDKFRQLLLKKNRYLVKIMD